MAERKGRSIQDTVARLWTERLQDGWAPPEGSAFAWAMVRVSLEALLPGLRGARDWLAWATHGLPAAREGFAADGSGCRLAARGPEVVAHVLAGNTPLLAWPSLAAATLAGSASVVKMSRGETLWPRLFVEALAVVDAELASRIHLEEWPGDDPRTAELVQAADAVIAYGGDAALAAVRAATPVDRLFLGYGHALSAGLVLAGADRDTAAAGFARDVLLYDQGGCLSPHAVFVEGSASDAAEWGAALAQALAAEAEALGVPPVTDAGVALAVRRERDLALFSPGASVGGDAGLRWTVVMDAAGGGMAAPVGHGVVSVLPLAEVVTGLGPALGAARGRLSSLGVAGPLRDEVRGALLREGIRRICAPGTMQAPPLDWPNGGRYLLASLLRWTEFAV